MKKIGFLLISMLISTSVLAAPKTVIAKLKANPEWGEESMHIQTDKGDFSFYIVNWDKKSFQAGNNVKRGQCLKIVSVGQNDGDQYIRKVKCPKK